MLEPRALFLFSAILFGGILSGGFVPVALWRLVSWIRGAFV